MTPRHMDGLCAQRAPSAPSRRGRKCSRATVYSRSSVSAGPDGAWEETVWPQGERLCPLPWCFHVAPADVH